MSQPTGEQRAVIREVRAFLAERKKQNPFNDKMLYRIYHIEYTNLYRVTFSDGGELLLKVLPEEQGTSLLSGNIIYDSTEEYRSGW